MRWIPIWLVVLLATAPAAIAEGGRHHHHGGAALPAARPLSDASLYHLSSKWTDQTGRTVSLPALRGGPVVVAMAYTRCKDMCPAIIADMLWIERKAADKALQARFAFFSLDSLNDKPPALRAYAASHGLDPARWSLYHGDDDAVRELAAALGVRYRRTANGEFDHSSVITLLDAEGRIAFQQQGVKADSAELVERLEKLLRDNR